VLLTRTITMTRAALATLPHPPTALVPTMGALHDGHLALLREARRFAGPSGSVVMSLFVNPTQFGAGEDYARYPRDEARDLALAGDQGVDLVFAPSADEMYPTGFATTVHVAGPLSEAFEGADRPGHFDGVATVVAKLFAVVRPDAAFFGRKDAQQLALIRRLAADLDPGVEVVGVETVRAADGLALSSRNAYLDERARAAAARLYAALVSGRAAARPGATPDDVIDAVLTAVNEGVDGGDEAVRFAPDYVAVVDPDTFVPEASLGERSLIIAAARLGTTRLVDNLPVRELAETGAPGPAAPTVLRGWQARAHQGGSSAERVENDTNAPPTTEWRAAQEG
jgi:pantoate--beta-alanine ligase